MSHVLSSYVLVLKVVDWGARTASFSRIWAPQW